MLLKLASLLWLRLRVYWSNFRNRNDVTNCDVNFDLSDCRDLLLTSKKLYERFIYTLDGADELFDSVRYPAQCYLDLINGYLKDDCDGYHAAMYHLATCNGMNCYLLTYIATDIQDSHTVLVAIDSSGKYRILDYTTMLSGETLDEALKVCLERRHVDIISYNLVKFNYNTKKYYIAKI